VGSGTDRDKLTEQNKDVARIGEPFFLMPGAFTSLGLCAASLKAGLMYRDSYSPSSITIQYYTVGISWRPYQLSKTWYLTYLALVLVPGRFTDPPID
jgi:hypothetical protein